jgi:hypothetical protein
MERRLNTSHGKEKRYFALEFRDGVAVVIFTPGLCMAKGIDPDIAQSERGCIIVHSPVGV